MTSMEELYSYYCRRSDCKPNTKFLQLLSSSGPIEVFDFSDNYVGPKGLEPVIETARINVHLKTLNLSYNWLDRDCISKIVTMAVRHPSLTSLDVSNNPLHASSSQPLLYLARSNLNIISINVAGTELNGTFLSKLDEILAGNVEKRNAAKRNEENETATIMTKKTQQDAVAAERPPDNTVQGSWTEDNSGGSPHFATWRLNNQYILTSKSPATLVNITLKQTHGRPQHIGFMVFLGKMGRKTLTFNATEILAESPMLEGTVTAQVVMPPIAGEPLNIIPFTFHPRRTGQFTLTATVDAHVPSSASNVDLSLRVVDPKFDWCHAGTLTGEWKGRSAGGTLNHMTWRSNPQFLLASQLSVPARKIKAHIIVTTKVDPDEVDNLLFGVAVVKPDLKQRPRLFLSEDDIIMIRDPERTNTIHMELDYSLTKNGVSIIPFASAPKLESEYTITCYTSEVCSLEPCAQQSKWTSYTRIGFWTEQTSGGCREENRANWVYNSCFNLHVDIACDAMFLIEATDVPPEVQNDPQFQVGVLVCHDTRDWPYVQPPKWVPVSGGKESMLWLNDLAAGDYVIVPCTKFGGFLATYHVTIHTSESVILSEENSLSDFITRRRMEQYEKDNEERAQRPLKAPPTKLLTNDSDTGAVATRERIIQEYLTTGKVYIDKDFPASDSSMYKDPSVIPKTAPATGPWKRPCEFLMEPVVFAPSQRTNPSVDALVPGHFNNLWFLSALAVLKSRPEMLQRLFVSQFSEYGMYQIRFFKFGTWVTVTIDDLLPIDVSHEYVCAHTALKECIWLPLMEKAYAKLHRSYETLESSSKYIGEALEDLTGYEVSTDTLNGAKKEWMWSKIYNKCRSESTLVSVCLESTASRAEDKKSSGILMDCAYTIVDARIIEGFRLVQIHNAWRDSTWKGRWSRNSKQWTPTIETALQYDHSADPSYFWMCLEDLCYYFNVVHTTEAPRHAFQMYGQWTVDTCGGTLDNVDWHKNPQYSLLVKSRPGSDEPTTVQITLHQRDARLTLTRAHDAVLEYPVGIGIIIAECRENNRKIMRLTAAEVATMTPIMADRQVSYTVSVNPKSKYIVIPCTSTPRIGADFLLSTSCKEDPAKLSLIESDFNVTVGGTWTNHSAGGDQKHGTWRNNPQFFIMPSVTTTLTIVLRQKSDTTKYIGFSVHKGKDARRLLDYVPADILAEATHDNDHSVTVNVTLKGYKESNGVPYVVVPSTKIPGQLGDFELSVVTNVKVGLKAVDEDLDWRFAKVDGEWSTAKCTAGGSFDYTSWRCNPQVHLFLEDDSTPNKSVDILLSLAVRKSASSLDGTGDKDGQREPIGFRILKGTPTENKVRRKVLFAPSDVVAAADVVFNDFVELRFQLPPWKYGYFVVPHTQHPFVDLSWSLSCYSASAVSLTSVTPTTDWKEYSEDGAWVLGVSAGGSRAKYPASWPKNPMFSLSSIVPVTAVIFLFQNSNLKGRFPRLGNNTKIIKRTEQYFPPKIISGENKLCIGVDVVTDTDSVNVKDFTVAAESRHVMEAEVGIVLSIPPGVTHLVVPHTFDSEYDGDFTLLFYADAEIDVRAISRGRKT